MKHAILVMGYGKFDVLQETINVLDDYDIDFIIHWDKRNDLPKLLSKKSKIICLNNRISVRWGTDLQTKAEKKLLSYVSEVGTYDYVHLISSSDIPLMDADHFKKFFTEGSYHIGFLDYHEDRIINRLKYYYPIRYFNVRPHFMYLILIKPLTYLNKAFKINRIEGKHIEKGCNWFSMDSMFVKEILGFKDFRMFMNTFTGDEFYVQTILRRLKPKKLELKYNYFSDDLRMTESSKMAARYIDWLRGKGKPYVFSDSDTDVNILANKFNTTFAFCRKVNDPNVIRKVINKVESK